MFQCLLRPVVEKFLSTINPRVCSSTLDFGGGKDAVQLINALIQASFSGWKVELIYQFRPFTGRRQ